MAVLYRSAVHRQRGLGDVAAAPCGMWLPENHLAYVVRDVIDQFDLLAMDEVYGK